MDRSTLHFVALLPPIRPVVQSHMHAATQIIVTRVRVNRAVIQALVVEEAVEEAARAAMLLEYPCHSSLSC